MKKSDSKTASNSSSQEPPKSTGDLTSEIITTAISQEPGISAQAEEILSDETDNAPSDAGENVSASDLSGDANRQNINTSPPVNPVVNPNTGIFDKAGTQFDPALHCVLEDGVTPRKKKDGTFRSRKTPASGILLPTVDQPANRAHIAAVQTVNLIVTMGRMLGGEIWKLQKSEIYDEESALVNAWKDYYISTGNLGIPPWMGLLMANAAYAGPRLMDENTRVKIGGLIQWIRNKTTSTTG